MMGLESIVRRGNNWVLTDPSEFWATELVAKGWLELGANAPNGYYSGEMEAIDRHLAGIITQLPNQKNIAVYDLGCGDGKKGVVFAAAAKAKGIDVVYIPEDVNKMFIEQAVQEAKKHDIKAITAGPRNFFAKDYASLRIKGANNLYLLLGNPNYPFPEIVSLLDKIMVKGDATVIGTELKRENVQDMIERYAADEKLSKWFFLIAERLGFREHDLVFNPKLDEEAKGIEIGFDIMSVPDELIRKWGMKPHERLVVVYSLRPTEQQLIEWLSSFDAKLYTNSDKTVALAYCTKKA